MKTFVDFDPNVAQKLLDEDLRAVPDNYIIGKYASDVLSKTTFKKLIPKGNALHKAAMADFVQRNTALSNRVVLSTDRQRILVTWKDILHKVFNSGEYQSNVITLNSCLDSAYAGPGKSRGTRYTDFVRKMFSSTLTTTSWSLYQHYRDNVSERWRQAELLRGKRYSVQQLPGSKLSSVPKDSTKNRTTCTEPSLNMFYQLGAKELMNGLLKKFYNVDLSTQPNVNKLMAQAGSIHEAYATLDLSNASDQIKYELVQYLLPPTTFAVLNKIRSNVTDVDGEQVRLEMYATMGNGFCFSLMTLLILTLIEAYGVHHRMSFINGVNTAVFGDDIIIPTVVYNDICQLLNDVGFDVNLTKSFSTGHFRESCGGDFLYGHNVRGVYIKEISNEANIYSIFNRYLSWSVKHSIPLTRFLAYVQGHARFRAIPLHAANDEGYWVPNSLFNGRKDKHGCCYYTALVPIPRRYNIGSDWHNYHGALIGFLGGYVTDGTTGRIGHKKGGDRNTITFRADDIVGYRVAKRSTPSWDWSFDAELCHKVLDIQLAWSHLLRCAHV